MKKKIYLPHIHYTIDFYSGKDIPKYLDNLMNTSAYAVQHTKSASIIVKRDKDIMPGIIVHEMMHVIHFINEDYQMDFAKEFEHYAYIMQYAVNQILGYKYK